MFTDSMEHDTLEFTVWIPPTVWGNDPMGMPMGNKGMRKPLK